MHAGPEGSAVDVTSEQQRKDVPGAGHVAIRQERWARALEVAEPVDVAFNELGAAAIVGDQPRQQPRAERGARLVEPKVESGLDDVIVVDSGSVVTVPGAGTQPVGAK